MCWSGGDVLVDSATMPRARESPLTIRAQELPNEYQSSSTGSTDEADRGCPIGLGEPAFDKLKADFGKGLLSIGACVAFSFGLGEEMANLPGSEISQNSKNYSDNETNQVLENQLIFDFFGTDTIV